MPMRSTPRRGLVVYQLVLIILVIILLVVAFLALRRRHTAPAGATTSMAVPALLTPPARWGAGSVGAAVGRREG
jgi:hypothetical protein